MDYNDFDYFFDRALDLSDTHYDRKLASVNRMVEELRPQRTAFFETYAGGVSATDPARSTSDGSTAEPAALIDHALEGGGGTTVVEEEDAMMDAAVDWLTNMGLYLMCLSNFMFMWFSGVP